VNNADLILVADDDENDLRMTLEALAARGARPTVVGVRDGAEALDFLHRRGEFKERAPGHPQFLLLDLNMPRLDGWEVLRQVKSDTALKTLPVVVFTSSRRDRDVRECYELGANAFVVKPIDFEQFLAVVREVHSFWAERNVPSPGPCPVGTTSDSPATLLGRPGGLLPRSV
jgi:CheY-like chemotaxis protein